MSQLSTEVDDAQALQLLGATEPQQHNVSTSFSASEDEALEAARAAEEAHVRRLDRESARASARDRLIWSAVVSRIHLNFFCARGWA